MPTKNFLLLHLLSNYFSKKIISNLISCLLPPKCLFALYLFGEDFVQKWSPTVGLAVSLLNNVLTIPVKPRAHGLIVRRHRPVKKKKRTTFMPCVMPPCPTEVSPLENQQPADSQSALSANGGKH